MTQLNNTKARTVAIATILIAGVAGSAMASDREDADGPQERAALAAAKITRQQAIAAAEQSIGGKAIRNGIENRDGRAIYYDVTVDKGGTPHKVLVDMQSGRVVSSAKDDDDERGEQRDDDQRRKKRR